MFSRFRNIFSKSKKEKEPEVVEETLRTPLEPENAADQMKNVDIESTSKETTGENDHLISAKLQETPELKESVGDEVGKMKLASKMNGEMAESTIQNGETKEAVEFEKPTKKLEEMLDSISNDLKESKNLNSMLEESPKVNEKVANASRESIAHNVGGEVSENVKTQALVESNFDKNQHEIQQNSLKNDDDTNVIQNGSIYAEPEGESRLQTDSNQDSFKASQKEVEEVFEKCMNISKGNSDLKENDLYRNSTNVNSTHKILENETAGININSVSGVSSESPTKATDVFSKAELDNSNNVASTHNSTSMSATATLDPTPNTITNNIIPTNITNNVIKNDSSAMSDDLTNNEVITSPSTTDSGNGGSELNTTATTIATTEASSASTSPSASSSSSSSLTSTAAAAAATTITPTTLVVTPTGNNGIACSAITNKLTEISEVAESLDAAIRDVQEDADLAESSHSTSSSTEKKLENLRSASIEDWHSRSTEDESFVTASEGNFTPHSHSSSFQTASGRTSSFISSDKNSFDASEADDSTFAFEMPELTTPPPLHNISFESSEHSYLSAQQSPSPIGTATATAASGRCRIIPIEIEPRDEIQKDTQYQDHDHDQDSIVGIEELHSQSVTPTPNHPHQHHYESIPIESESEHEASSSCIADAPSMEILTEVTPMISVTPEVSNCAIAPTAGQATNTNKPPNAAWRRNKYYENITKQTIKGFL